MRRFYYVMTAMLMVPALAAAQQYAAVKPVTARRNPTWRIWAHTIGLPSTALKRVVNGSVATVGGEERARTSADRAGLARCRPPGALLQA
jgi:hypothetical protein